MRPENNIVEGKTPTVGENPTGSAAGLGVTPADAADTRVAAGFLMVRPEVSCEVTVVDLPLPLQVIARAAMFFAEKAADGADVSMVWDERCEDPYLEIRGGAGKLHIGWNRETNVLAITFTKARKGYYFIKRCSVGVDRTDAENIVRLAAEMLIDAVENSYVRMPAQLERFFKTGEWW